MQEARKGYRELKNFSSRKSRVENVVILNYYSQQIADPKSSSFGTHRDGGCLLLTEISQNLDGLGNKYYMKPKES